MAKDQGPKIEAQMAERSGVLRSMGEHCKLPQWIPGLRPSNPAIFGGLTDTTDCNDWPVVVGSIDRGSHKG